MIKSTLSSNASALFVLIFASNLTEVLAVPF